MALMPGFDTRSAAQVAHQVAQEQLEQQRITEGARAREQEIALRMFQGQQANQIRRSQMQMAREQQLRDFSRRTLEQAVELGIKWDPASKGYRPLTADDVEFTPWKERQAERKRRLPPTAQEQVELARTKELAVQSAKLPFEMGREFRREARDVREFRREAGQAMAQLRVREQGRMIRFREGLNAQYAREDIDAANRLERIKYQADLNVRAIKLKHQLEAPLKKQTAEEKKQATAAKAAESKFTRSQVRYQQAVKNYQQALKTREQVANREWPAFQSARKGGTFPFGIYPERQRIEQAPEGELARGGFWARLNEVQIRNDWNRLMRPQNQVVERSRQLMEQTQLQYQKALYALQDPPPRSVMMQFMEQARQQAPNATPEELGTLAEELYIRTL